jgi:hypothetical protein
MMDMRSQQVLIEGDRWRPRFQAQPAPSCTVFVGGAGDKAFTHIVERELHDEFARWLKSQSGDHKALYFGQGQKKKIKARLRFERSIKKTSLIVVGHSWGADTAVDIARYLDAQEMGWNINLLVTLDPVSRSGPPKSRPGVDFWLNVDAKAKKASFNDRVAKIGGNWGKKVEGLVDEFYATEFDHADVVSMMRFAPSGKNSAWQIIKEYVLKGELPNRSQEP